MREVLKPALPALPRCVALLCSVIVCLSSARVANAQRAPAVPLVTHDPYFSIWFMADRLTDLNTRHWTGVDQPLTGLVRIDAATYRFMGADPPGGGECRRRGCCTHGLSEIVRSPSMLAFSPILRRVASTRLFMAPWMTK